jgi:uncharacterized protein YfkK (UPF0435 family)
MVLGNFFGKKQMVNVVAFEKEAYNNAVNDFREYYSMVQEIKFKN